MKPMIQAFLAQARQDAFGDTARGRSFWSSLFFGGFTALSLFVLVRLLLSTKPLQDNMEGILVTSGALVVSIAMLVDWTRMLGLNFRYGRPGKWLSLVSKLLGWLGLAMLPATIYLGSLPMGALCCALPLLSWQLWMGRPWAALPWYAVPVLMLAAFVWHIRARLDLLATDPAVGTSFGTGRLWGLWFGAFIQGAVLLLLAVWFVWEVSEWRRRIQRAGA